MRKAITFLLDLWEDQSNDERLYFCISTKSAGAKWKDHFLRWPIERKTLEDFFEKRSTNDNDLYFCPHGLTEPIRRKEHAAPTMYLWGDLDEADPARCKPVPQIAWQTSPGRHAALWRLSRYYAADEIEEVNRALSYSIQADPSGWDITQVLRIPYTRNHKYSGSPAGRMLWDKDNTYALGDFPTSSAETGDDPHVILAKYKGKIKTSTMRLLTATAATSGTRSDMIWKLENDLHEQGVTMDEIFLLIKSSVWNKFAGRRNEDGQLRRELEKVADRHNRPSIAGASPKKVNGHANGHEPKRGIVRMSDIEAETVKFLWYPYMALGKMTIMEGDPGLGKSWLTMAITSALSQGIKLPSSDKKFHGRVLLMSAEDGLADTIRPRLDTLNADVKRVFAIPHPVTFSEDGIEEIERYIEECKPLLVIIDPLVAYMGGDVDMHKANEVREVMSRMAIIAEKYNIAMLLVRHLTKGGKDKAIYRGIGSIDFTAAVRSVIMIGRNPDAPDEGRVMVHIKSNLTPLGPSQSYSLRPRSDTPFSFDGEVSFTAEDVFKTEPTGGKSIWQECIDFIKETLADGARFADDIRRDAEAKGIDSKTVNQVKRELKLIATTLGGRIKWRLNLS